MQSSTGERFNRCMGCMAPKTAEAICPVCGFVEGTEPTSHLHLRPGVVLNDRYVLGRVLGHGGFGITYLGWDLNLNLKLAIKEYFPAEMATRAEGHTQVTAYSGESGAQFQKGLEKFLDEARTLAQFEGHPNIISARDFFRLNSTAYLVMNFLDGVTLREYLRGQGGPISFETALNLMMPVMDALREVHKVGILHRDISPDNIFITYSGVVKVLDFGAARQLLNNQKSISVVLKPGYAPEEQYRTRGVQGPWTDVYATAATFYRLITGVVPPEALDRLDEDTLQPPSHLGTDIPAFAENALMKALSVRATGRYQSIDEFQDGLLGNTQTAAHTPYQAPPEQSFTPPVVGMPYEQPVQPVEPPVISAQQPPPPPVYVPQPDPASYAQPQQGYTQHDSVYSQQQSAYAQPQQDYTYTQQQSAYAPQPQSANPVSGQPQPVSQSPYMPAQPAVSGKKNTKLLPILLGAVGVVVVAVVLIIVLTAGGGGGVNLQQAAAIQVQRMQMTTGVDSSMRNVDTVTTYSPEVDQFLVSVQCSQIPQGAQFYFKWTLEPLGEEYYSGALTLRDQQNGGYMLARSSRLEQWSAGTYRVGLYVVGYEQALNEISFRVGE